MLAWFKSLVTIPKPKQPENPFYESVLSQEPDGLGFFYGYLKGDRRQINIRFEGGQWMIYVDGRKIGQCERGATLMEAERMAIRWMKDNPDEE